MYYNNKHQSKLISSSRMFISSKSHQFVRGGNATRDSGLILSTDAKPRLKWTQDLHERFVEAVNQLGGGDKATPKTIMKAMGIPGLTLYHLKSHLQKYRLSKNLNGHTNSSSNKIGMMTMIEEKSPETYESYNDILRLGPMPNMILPINDALQLQIEVQRRLHQQLELRIEAQGKYLQTILEKAQETLGRQNLSATSIETTKEIMEEELSWPKQHLSENPKPKISPSRKNHGRLLTIEMELQEHKRTQAKTEYTEEKIMKKDEDCNLQTRIDLNIHDENYVITNPKQFDLNGFSWS